MSAQAAEAAQAIALKFSDNVLETREFRGEHTLVVAADHARGLLAYARGELGFDYLIDITSIDNFGDDPRWELVYELYSFKTKAHLRLKYALPEDQKAPTVSDLWPTANWHEREVFDMMGIEFENHPDLRRILMWDGYPYYPLRKDFPLAGRPSDMPDVAFSDAAPLDGGPFVTSPTDASTVHREPRSHEID